MFYAYIHNPSNGNKTVMELTLEEALRLMEITELEVRLVRI
jgi:hypothetical protein